MKRVIMSLGVFVSCSFSETVYLNQYANIDKKNPQDSYRSGFNFNTDIGYTFYLIDVTSSELSRAIDYNVIEATLGGSYAYGNWMWGIDTKLLLKEQGSNLTSMGVTDILNDTATIDRNEFSLFSNYKLTEELRINLVYRYSSLTAKDSYVSFKRYDTLFKYKTSGLATSLVYMPYILNGLVFSAGAVYSKADVKVLEKVNDVADDVSIDDSSSSFGFKLGVGYNYSFKNDITLRVIADWYRFDFGQLDVYSQSQKRVFEQASLNEETYAVRVGMAYRF